MNFAQKTNLPCRRALIGALLALLLFAVPAGAAAKPRHGVTAAVVHRTLTITGDKHANKVALRVGRRAHNTLQVDAGDDGRADFSFKRRLFDRIVVRGGGGNDVLHVDERNRTRADNLALGRAGGLLRVTGTSRIDATSIERVELSTGSGADSVTIGDLTGTGVRQVSVDEGADADRLTVPGSPAADSFGLGRFGPFVHLQRDAQAIDAIHAERLDLEAGGGADTLALADLTGTDLRQLNLALGGSDGQSDNVVATGSDGADAIAVTGGFGVAITGLAPAVAITGTEPGDALTVDGRGGADSIDASGLPAGRMRLTLRGGPDADTLTGSPGDDTFRSAPGDGADTVDGKAGIDTAAMDGSSASDSFSAAANGSRAQLTRGPDGGAVDATGVERVDLNGLGGADASTVDNLAGTDVTQTTVDMGAGDGAADSAKVNGTAGADNVKLAGGGGGSVNVTGLGSTVSIANADPAADTLTVDTLAGNDSIHASDLAAGSAALRLIGGPGADNLNGSAGDDTFVWNPGDESDILQGNQGADTLQFNGSDANETMSLSANGSRLAFFRDVGIVTQDAAGIERVDVNPIGGGDIIQVGNLSGTDVTQVGVDLAASDGGADGTADAVIVNGTPNPDRITVGGDASSIRVNAGQPVVSITRAEPAKDNLIVVGAAGADTVDASGLAAGAIGLVVNGGRDADVMIGSEGDDIFPWNPGDGSDTIEGQGGTDTMQFNGANVAEQIVVGANGSRVRFTRDVAGVTMDLAGVEHINFTARGGADRITVGDLSATDVTQTNLDISNGVGAGDGAADNVFVTGTNVSDTVNVSGSAGAAAVTGLHSSVSITGAEPANDRLTVSAENGDDVVEASGLAADAIALTENGGNGADVLIGGAGNDILHGDADDDVLNGGPGNDTLDGGTGNNILIQ